MVVQARETIIQMLKAQIQERRDAAQDIRKCVSLMSSHDLVPSPNSILSSILTIVLNCARRTIDESRKAVELVHSELHETAGDDANRTDAGDVKMEDAESSDGSARQHALENGLLSPTGAQAEQSAVRSLPMSVVFECL